MSGPRSVLVAAAIVTLPLSAVLPASAATAALPGTSMTGTVTVRVADPVPGSGRPSRTIVELRAGSSVRDLPPSTAVRLHTGDRVTVTGVVSGRSLTPSRIIPAPVPDARTPTPAVSTTGTDAVYVIRATWTGAADDATTTAQVQDYFDQAAAWFTEVSYGQFAITPTVGAGWRTVAAPNGCDVDTIYSEAVAAEHAATPTFDPSAYRHVVVYFPLLDTCDFAGLGDIGGPQVWLNGTGGWYTTLTPNITTHELGHNLGLYHSHSVICSDATSAFTTVSDTCDAPAEYGDSSDVMGDSQDLPTSDPNLYIAAHYSAPQKQQLGWLGPRLDTLAEPCGTVDLAPYEAGTGTVSADWTQTDPATGAQDTYWLEWRQPGPASADAELPTGLTDGAVLHRTESSDADPGPLELDGTPGTGTDFTDAALPSGSSVTTPEGTSIAVGAPASGTLPVTLTPALPGPAAAPSASAVSGTASATGAVALSWTPPSCAGATAISGYAVQDSADGGTWTDVSVTPAAGASIPATSGTVTGLASGHDYRFRVSAVNTAGTGAWSPASAPVTLAAPVVTPDATALDDAGTATVTYGGAAKITATLTDTTTSTPVAAATVTVESRAPGAARWATVGAAVTGSSGRATVTVKPVRTTQYRAVFAGDATHATADGPVITTVLRQAVSAHRAAGTVRRNRPVTLYGVVGPAVVGIAVRVQREVHGRWTSTAAHAATRRQLLPDGTVTLGYVVRWTAARAGSYPLRVLAAATASAAAGTSKAVTVRVR